MNGTKLIGSHLLKYSQNLKLKIYNVNTICAFTNEHIEKGIKLSDLIKEKFVDYEFIKYSSEYCSVESALLIEQIIPNQNNKLNPIRNYSFFCNENELTFLKREDLENILFMQKENLEYSENHYKRWNSKDDDLANFGKNKRQISIQAGKFKSYIIPRVLHTINKVWFYFDTDNLKYLEYLIDTYLFGIGKKVSSGHGEIESKTIEIVDFNPFEKEIIRPIPINSIKNNTIETFDLNKVKIVSIRRLPPYHSSINKEKCFVI